MPQPLATTYSAPLVASWELDLFGRIRRLNEGARAEADASAATFEALRLSLTAEVAANYFSLRALDQESALIADGVELRAHALELVNSRRRGGAATDFDVARAETELSLTQAEAAATANRRSALQNALAVLVGRTGGELPARPGDCAAGDHSSRGARGPAERPARAPARRGRRGTHARRGQRAHRRGQGRVLSGDFADGGAGYASGDIDLLFKSDSRTWSIGPSLYLPIFQGGRNRANLARSRAAYDESVATFARACSWPSARCRMP